MVTFKKNDLSIQKKKNESFLPCMGNGPRSKTNSQVSPNMDTIENEVHVMEVGSDESKKDRITISRKIYHIPQHFFTQQTIKVQLLLSFIL